MSLALRLGHVISVKIRLGCKSFIDFDYDITGHTLITHHLQKILFMFALFCQSRPFAFFLYNNVRLTASNKKEVLHPKYFICACFYHLMLLAKLCEGRHRALFIRRTLGSVDLLSIHFQNFHYKSLLSGIYNSAIKILP